MSDPATDIIATHGGKIATGIGAAMLAAFKWLIGREVRRIDSASTDHEQRIRSLEDSRVTRDDIDDIKSSMREHREETRSQFAQIITLISRPHD